MLTVMTVVGTRPELIRLSRTIALLDECTRQVLVHTGQNYDQALNQIFFDDLGIRAPDVYLDVDTTSLGSVLGGVLLGVEAALGEHRPDAMVILGDTNSCIAALMARRHQVPVYHLEAGNRSFDENVPEEINRRMIDHISDYNLAYTEHARRNLLAEGLHPSRVMVTGSPMREVLDHQRAEIAASAAVSASGVAFHDYFLVSLHREENVDEPERLATVLNALDELARTYDLPVLISMHPRTRQRIEAAAIPISDRLRPHEPFNFSDYICLQEHARCVLSDSGTVSEESAILGFPAVTLRSRIERPESLEAGTITTVGIDAESILDSVAQRIARRADNRTPTLPPEYAISDFSARVVNYIRSTAASHHEVAGIRRRSAIWDRR
jgi:UDP-N-acetylglucosamine 2-epimerase